jgi:hypothetical protein
VSNGKPAPSAAALTLKSPVFWAAVVVLIGFVVLFLHMLDEVEAAEARWSRLTWLYGTVEAIVFAAAGALFGTQVQRARVESAERKADATEQDAKNGRTLAATAKALARHAAPGGGTLEFSRAFEQASSPEQKSIMHCAARADELFPDV